jgi:ParB-like chromosome segregation protein Spo0J
VRPVRQIAASLGGYCTFDPILVHAVTRTIVAGSARLLAAHRLGLFEVPVVVLDHLTEGERRAYVIAEARLASTHWDGAAVLAAHAQGRIQRDLDSGKCRAEVQREVKEGEAGGVMGTPTFFINGKRCNGPFELPALQPIFQAELRGTGKTVAKR